jgi:hypothetical protein
MKLLLFLFTVTLLFSCDPKETVSSVVLPTNLSTNIAINEGLVEVQATADEANYYSFMFYDIGDSSYSESNEGSAEYTYSVVGEYSVKVRAHVTAYDYIEITENIIISDVGYTGGIPTTGYITPDNYPNYSLIWSDEFNGSSLSSDWVHEIGNGSWGWGNNELQFYKEENTVVEDGLLKITAKEESAASFNYTSSRIKTQGLQSFQYGRIDVRAALPYGQGYWPAIWMLGENISSAGWPSCGEIDIMELVGGGSFNNRTIHGTVHWSENGAHASYGDASTLPSGEMYAEQFHVFSIIWNASSIRFLRDDVQYHDINISGSDLSAFQNNFFLILNVAVGGNWPGSPNQNTLFPQTMAVDYVRVFQ